MSREVPFGVALWGKDGVSLLVNNSFIPEVNVCIVALTNIGCLFFVWPCKYIHCESLWECNYIHIIHCDKID